MFDGTDGDVVAPKETPEERATRFGVSHVEQEFSRDGRLSLTTLTGAGSKQKKRVRIPCKYEEDEYINGHTAVWGSYFHKGAFRWGYTDDHSLMQSSYGTGINGRIANDESNKLQYGSGMAGSPSSLLLLLAGCNQVSNSRIDCSVVCCLAVLF
jgi:hypothetical protein